MLLEQKRYLEQFVAQFVDRSCVNEGWILHDIEKTVAHFDLYAHFEPLIVYVKSGTDFGCTVETAGN